MEKLASKSDKVDSYESQDQQNPSAPTINSEFGTKRRKENSNDDDNCE